MSKQINPNIGVVSCSECSEFAALRKDRNGKFYYDCLDCGRISPNLPDGQGRLLDRADVWGATGPKSNCPRWIAEQWRWSRALRDPSGRQPIISDNVNKAPAADSVNGDIDDALPPEPPSKLKNTEAPAPESVEDEVVW